MPRPSDDVDAYVAGLQARGIPVTVGPAVRVDHGHLRPATGTYRELRKPETGRGLVTPPPKGISGVELVFAVRVVSESNDRAHGHWSARHRRAKAQAAVLESVLAGVVVPPLPVRVLWTKLGGGRLDRSNLVGAFKAMDDALAAHYRTDDRDGSGIEWDYDQEPGGLHGVRVLIAAGGPPP